MASWTAANYGFGEFDTLVPAEYAATIHEPWLQISSRDHPRPHPALSDAAIKSRLHRHHSRVLLFRRGPSGLRYSPTRGSQRFGPTTLVEAR